MDVPARTVVESLESRTHLHGGDDHGRVTNDFAVNPGGPDYRDTTGVTWEADSGFKVTRKSRVGKTAHAIANTTLLDTVLQTSRQDYNLHWSAEVPDATYTLSLYFAEPDYAKAGQRVFDINLQGRRKVNNFDVVQAAGGKDKAVVKTFTVRVTDGDLVVDLPSLRDRSILNGIRVEQTDFTGTLPTKTLTWKTKASAPIKTEESVSFTAGGKLYLIGGYVNGEFAATTRVDAYDPATNTWTRKADSPTKLTHAGVAVDTGRHTVWFMGGFIGDFPEPDGTRIVWRYDYVHDTWRKGPDLPVSRGGGGGAIIGNKLYYFSGATADRSADSGANFVYDLGAKNPKWTPIATLPTPRNHFGTVTVGTKVYLIGGQTGLEAESVSTDTVYVYDTITNKWSESTPMPKPYSHFSSTISLYKNRYVLIAGGENPHAVALSDVLMFDTVKKTWTKLTNLPAIRRAAAGGIIGNTYVVSTGFVFIENQQDTTWTADLKALGL